MGSPVSGVGDAKEGRMGDLELRLSEASGASHLFLGEGVSGARSSVKRHGPGGSRGT